MQFIYYQVFVYKSYKIIWKILQKKEKKEILKIGTNCKLMWEFQIFVYLKKTTPTSNLISVETRAER